MEKNAAESEEVTVEQLKAEMRRLQAMMEVVAQRRARNEARVVADPQDGVAGEGGEGGGQASSDREQGSGSDGQASSARASPTAPPAAAQHSPAPGAAPRVGAGLSAAPAAASGAIVITEAAQKRAERDLEAARHDGTFTFRMARGGWRIKQAKGAQLTNAAYQGLKEFERLDLVCTAKTHQPPCPAVRTVDRHPQTHEILAITETKGHLIENDNHQHKRAPRADAD